LIEKLREILNEHWDGNVNEVGPDTVLTADLGMNSMELFDLICDIEEAFGVEIPDKVLPKLVTVRDVVECLEEMVREGEG